jgi:hypothetical protein
MNSKIYWFRQGWNWKTVARISRRNCMRRRQNCKRVLSIKIKTWKSVVKISRRNGN